MGDLVVGSAAEAPARRRTATPSPLPLLGAGLILVGSLLPWVGEGDRSLNAWDIPFLALLDHDPTTSELWVGYVLLVPLVALLPYVTRTPFGPPAFPLFGAVATCVAMAGLLLINDGPTAVLDVGAGVGVTFLGGVVMSCEYFVARPSSVRRNGRFALDAGAVVVLVALLVPAALIVQSSYQRGDRLDEVNQEEGT